MRFLRWSVYFANGKVLVPTYAVTTVGVGAHIDPMEVVDVEDSESLFRAILSVITKGNPVIPHPSRDELSRLGKFYKKLGFGSNRAFCRSALLIDMQLAETGYSLQFWKPAIDNRGFDPDPSREIVFPAGTPIEPVIERLIKILQEAHRQEAR